jgi:hypothetical protein
MGGFMDRSMAEALRTQAYAELREAELALGSRSLAARARYENALYELDRVERKLARMERELLAGANVEPLEQAESQAR